MRKPSQEELADLTQVYLRNYADNEQAPTEAEELAAKEIVARAAIVVWDEYLWQEDHSFRSWRQPVDKLMIVVWDGDLNCLDVLIWQDSQVKVLSVEPVLFSDE